MRNFSVFCVKLTSFGQGVRSIFQWWTPRSKPLSSCCNPRVFKVMTFNLIEKLKLHFLKAVSYARMLMITKQKHNFEFECLLNKKNTIPPDATKSKWILGGIVFLFIFFNLLENMLINTNNNDTTSQWRLFSWLYRPWDFIRNIVTSRFRFRVFDVRVIFDKETNEWLRCDFPLIQCHWNHLKNEKQKNKIVLS